MKTVSLQLARQLKGAGFPQGEDGYYWVNHNMGTLPADPNGWILATKDHSPYGGSFNAITHKLRAPFAEDILEKLPAIVEGERIEIYKVNYIWNIAYGQTTAWFRDEVLAEAVGRMFKYLAEQNLL